MKGAEIFVLSLRVVNYLGCSGQNAIIFIH